jgi:hypothetical protein
MPKIMKRHTVTIIRKSLSTRLAGGTAFAAVMLAGGVNAQPWQTILDYQFVAGTPSQGWSMAADSLGNVFSGGDGFLPSGAVSGLILQMDPSSLSWPLRENTNPAAENYSTHVRRVACGANGRIYSAGRLDVNCSGRSCPGSTWLVNMGSAAGAPGSWTVLDSYQLAPGKGAVAYGVTETPSGSIFVAGAAYDAKGKYHGLLRTSDNGGQSWTTVDDVPFVTLVDVHYTPDSGMFTTAHSGSWQVRRGDGTGNNWSTVDQPFAGQARRLGHDASGNVYAVGTARKSSKKTGTVYDEWTVRKWNLTVAAWVPADVFALGTFTSSIAWDIATDRDGHPVVVGGARDVNGINHWIVRRLDSSGSWGTIDNYQAPGLYAEALGIAADASGNLWVCGSAADANGTEHWIVRRLPPTNP